MCVAEKPGTRTGSTQRGCCKNWGESTEDDGFDEAARRERLAKSPKKRHGKNPDNKDLDDGGNEEKNPKEGNKGEEGGGDRTVNQQPGPSPEMSADTADATTKLEEGTESGGPER